MANRAKAETEYVCQECGHRQTKWDGKCPACGKWNSLAEEARRRDVSPTSRKAAAILGSASSAALEPLAGVEGDAGGERTPTGIGELDRVLGGGLVAGSAVLVGGEPGVGKSTLAIQFASGLAARGRPVLYVSGEEAALQVRRRGERLGLPLANILVLADIDVDAILRAMKDVRPSAVIVDSVQTIRTSRVESAPGSVSQLREATAELITGARTLSSALWLIGHVTKDGAVAGPRILEHMVDSVLYFEGDRHGAFRILRAVKNRFGPTGELGVFEMHGNGLVEVENPSSVFVGATGREAPGSVISACIEGSRPLLVEIQSLVSPSHPGSARRTTVGVDHARVAMLAAVVEKHLGLSMASQDVFVNTAGGVRIDDPGVDLAIIAALASSYLDKALPARTLVLGEVGLTGEVRPVTQVRARLREAARLGFERAIVGGEEKARTADLGLKIQMVATVGEAWEALRDR
ncbi:MAG TPA: DNA repair protein RadA [Candidatus Limnocylindrales bacterium]|nr:DNA repair protein RadA [Candidatus Limnocylindrales bacterium]